MDGWMGPNERNIMTTAHEYASIRLANSELEARRLAKMYD